MITFKQKDSSQRDINLESNNEIEIVDTHKDNKHIIEEDKEGFNYQINQSFINANNPEFSHEYFQKATQEYSQEERDNKYNDIVELHDGGEESNSLEDCQASDIENHQEDRSEDYKEDKNKLTFGDNDDEKSQKSNEDQCNNKNIEEFKPEVYYEHNEDNLINNNEYSKDINEESSYMDNEENYSKSNEENAGQNQRSKQWNK